MRTSFIITTLVLILGGITVANLVQTNSGDVAVSDVRFNSDVGELSALLYRPSSANKDAPAPGILAVHGYINSRETQSGFAIEFARRGFVVLALDQTGHGYSAPPAFAAGFGGPAALKYLRELPFVDIERMGLEGHSMGGWTVQMAAAAMPDAYHAMVLQGSSTGTFGAPEGTPTSPRNLLLVFSLFDEFSQLMWGADVPAEIVSTQKLKTLFGTSESVVPGKRYGDLNAGTLRKLTMPPVTHPGDHLSRAAIGDAMDWFADLLGSPHPMTSDNQTWYWKELATGAALIGLAMLTFILIGAAMPKLNKNGFFSLVQTPTSKPIVTTRSMQRLSLAATICVPIILFFPVQTLANLVLPASSFLPQQITNGFLMWAISVAAISLLILYFSTRGQSFEGSGLIVKRRTIAGSMLLAIACFAALYVVVLATETIALVDFRFWVVALKRMSGIQVRMFLIYLPFFTVFFLALSASLHLTANRTLPLRTAMWRNALLLSSGYIALLVAQYVPLVSGGSMLIASQHLLTIVAFQFIPLMAFVALVSTYCFYRTNNIYTGAFLNSLVITWYMVAGTATQAVPFWL